MVKFFVNDQLTVLDVSPEMPLLWALRDYAGLTGSKYGCGKGLCGACTVHLDGHPIRSCITRIGKVRNKKITTIEGVQGKVAEVVKSAWRKLDVPQCGYCQSGQIMSAIALLESNAQPTDRDIDQIMGGNICRCGTYQRIRAAIYAAAANLK